MIPHVFSYKWQGGMNNFFKYLHTDTTTPSTMFTLRRSVRVKSYLFCPSARSAMKQDFGQATRCVILVYFEKRTRCWEGQRSLWPEEGQAALVARHSLTTAASV